MSDREHCEQIERAREAIDAIDADLVKLLNLRARRAATIGEAKRAMDESIYQPDREAEVFAHAVGSSEGPLDDGAIRRIFERILDEARRLERLSSKK
jgi:chorismate mutase